MYTQIFQAVSFLQVPHQRTVCIVHFYHPIRTTCPASLVLRDLITLVWREIQTLRFVTIQCLLASSYSVSGANISLTTLCSNTLSV